MALPTFARTAAALLLWAASSSLAQADIQIGAALPRSGPQAVYGDQVLAGVKAAVDAINGAGGVNGEKLSLVVEDDVCDPKNAVSVANRIVQQGIKFVVGHVCSGASMAASDVYAENGVIMISPSTLAGKLTDRNLPGIFRVCGRDDQQGEFAAEYIAENFKDKRIAILHDAQAFSRGLADVVKPALNKRGVNEVLFQGITPGERDYSAVITRLKAAQIDLVYFGGYQQEMGQLVRQSPDAGFKPQWFGSSGIATTEFAAIAGPISDGVLMTFTRDPRKLAGSKSVVDAFRSRGIEPDGFTLYAYAATQIFGQALAATKTRDVKSVEKTMKSQSFDTVLGPMSFNAKGDVTTPAYVMYVWKDGKFDYK